MEAKVKKALVMFTVAALVLIIIGAGIILRITNQAGTISEDDLNLESFEDVNTTALDLTTEEVGQINQEKELFDQKLEANIEKIDVLNANEEVTSKIKEVFGESYSLYVFSAYQGLFKVVEWSVVTEDGLITSFESGNIITEPDAIVELEQTVVTDLLQGTPSASQVASWITQGKVKVDPLSEVAKVTQVLPTIIDHI